MRQDKKLSLLMGLFFLIVLISFGLIVANEKTSIYNIPKVDKKINNYIKDKYPNIKVNKGKTIYKAGLYKSKVTSIKNKNLYFYINYKNKKITSTYKRDYLEGKTLLNKISNDLRKQISNKINHKVKVKINKPLNSYSNQVKERIIDEKDIIELSIYDVYIDLNVTSIDKDSVYNSIINIMDKFENKNIVPKSYYITITNKNNIVEAIEINNINSKIEKDELKIIINDIIDKKESDILNKYNITYKYLN